MKVHVALVVVLMVLSMGCMEESKEDKNKPPVANLKIANAVYNLGEKVIFDASGSRDPDGDIDHYIYYFGDGQNSGSRGEPYFNYTYEITGDMQVTLVVWDDQGGIGTASKNIKINLPPVAAFTITNSTDDPTDEAWVNMRHGSTSR
jgi:hypothetical protein